MLPNSCGASLKDMCDTMIGDLDRDKTGVELAKLYKTQLDHVGAEVDFILTEMSLVEGMSVELLQIATQLSITIHQTSDFLDIL